MFKKFLFVCIAGAIVTLQAAVQRDICLLLDGSASISDSDFQLQLQANANAIKDPNIIPQDGSIAISVVQFSSSVQVEVHRTVITSQAVADQVANAIMNITQLNGSTNMDLGIQTCMQELNTSNTNAKQIIDLSTDGKPSDEQAAYDAADAAVQAGLDALNAIGVGSEVDVTILENLVRPQPASQPPQDGFVVTAQNFNEYESILRQKLKIEAGNQETGNQTVTVPLSPFAKFLIMFSFLAIGLVFLRKKSTLS